MSIPKRYILLASVSLFASTFSIASGLAGPNQVAQGADATGLTNLPALFLQKEIEIQGQKDTNGWSCVISLGNIPRYSDETPPVCGVMISNILPTNVMSWAGFYAPTYSRIQLLDSNGKPVQKTAQGKEIGTKLTDSQIREMVKARFQNLNRGRARNDGFIPLRPGQNSIISFSLPDLFKITDSGEYTLEVQTCLVLRTGGEKYDPNLTVIRPPKIAVKVPITSEKPAK